MLPIPLPEGFRIISGGQTGADRAALDWAIRRGVPHGGWCPRGRLAEEGPIPPRYRLRETPQPLYEERTAWNVRDADATVIFSIAPELRGGSLLTRELARQMGKPWLHLPASLGVEEAARRLAEFVRACGARTLNAAGPRASNEPQIGRFVIAVLDCCFGADTLPVETQAQSSG